MTKRLDPSILDVFFRTLADERRRRLLSLLLDDGDGSATVDELAAGVMGAESHSPTSDRQSVTVSLAHDHLPRLAGEGLIEYDRDRDVVTTTSRTDQIQPYLALIGDLGPAEATPP